MSAFDCPLSYRPEHIICPPFFPLPHQAGFVRTSAVGRCCAIFHWVDFLRPHRDCLEEAAHARTETVERGGPERATAGHAGSEHSGRLRHTSSRYVYGTAGGRTEPYPRPVDTDRGRYGVPVAERFRPAAVALGEEFRTLLLWTVSTGDRYHFQRKQHHRTVQLTGYRRWNDGRS